MPICCIGIPIGIPPICCIGIPIGIYIIPIGCMPYIWGIIIAGGIMGWRGKLRCSAEARRRDCSNDCSKAGAFAQSVKNPAQKSNRAARESLRDYELRSAYAREHSSKEA